MRDRKAAEVDEVPAEVWKYGERIKKCGDFVTGYGRSGL